MGNSNNRYEGPMCPLPWVHMALSVEGVWSRCCFDRTNDYDYLYVTPVRPVFRLQPDSLGAIPSSRFALEEPDAAAEVEKAFNSDAMRETRRAMLAGQAPHVCDYCYHVESMGGFSPRLSMWERYDSKRMFLERLQATASDGHVPSVPISLDLRLGNKCNLRCIMCSYPTSSRFGAPEQARWQESVIDPYFESPEFWASIERIANELHYLYLAGGEPFLQSTHFRLLDLLVELGVAADVMLEYNTNLTVVPRRLVLRLKSFARVVIGASCDGIGPLYERIRVGAAWNKFVSNLRILKCNFQMRLDMAIQAANIFAIPEVVAFARAEGVGIQVANLVHYPEELSVLTLTTDDRERAVVMLDSEVKRARRSGDKELSTQLQRLLDYVAPEERQRG